MTDSCAIGGDHPARGQSVSAINMPGGWYLGYRIYLMLAFCDQHDGDIGNYPPGTTFHGKIKIGMEDKHEYRTIAGDTIKP